LFSLYRTVLTLKRQISDNRFDTETTNQRQQYHKAFKCFQSRFDFETVLEAFGSLTVYFADMSFHCQNGAKKAETVSFQMLSNASKCFQMLPNASK
jgi:hypothetical protein